LNRSKSTSGDIEFDDDLAPEISIDGEVEDYARTDDEEDDNDEDPETRRRRRTQKFQCVEVTVLKCDTAEHFGTIINQMEIWPARPMTTWEFTWADIFNSSTTPNLKAHLKNTVTFNFLHAFCEEDMVRNPEFYPDELRDTSFGSVDSDIVDTAASSWLRLSLAERYSSETLAGREAL